EIRAHGGGPGRVVGLGGGAHAANLDTAFVAARACLPDLIERRGAIVLVASIASLAAGPAVCGYTTAKHALIGLTRSLAR
ncbi:SDR family NAD(P)-dependent oxidoreductase, partial [Rhizobium ruizarguesonis]